MSLTAGKEFLCRRQLELESSEGHFDHACGKRATEGATIKNDYSRRKVIDDGDRGTGNYKARDNTVFGGEAKLPTMKKNRIYMDDGRNGQKQKRK